MPYIPPTTTTTTMNCHHEDNDKDRPRWFIFQINSFASHRGNSSYRANILGPSFVIVIVFVFFWSGHVSPSRLCQWIVISSKIESGSVSQWQSRLLSIQVPRPTLELPTHYLLIFLTNTDSGRNRNCNVTLRLVHFSLTWYQTELLSQIRSKSKNTGNWLICSFDNFSMSANRNNTGNAKLALLRIWEFEQIQITLKMADSQCKSCTFEPDLLSARLKHTSKKRISWVYGICKLFWFSAKL